MKLSIAFCAVLGFFVAANSSATAADITEYFNNYGDVSGNLNTKGAAGAGWTSGWTGSLLPKYDNGSQLDYFAPGYIRGGNGSNANTDGLAHSGAPNAFHLPNPDGIDPNAVAVRSFNPLTGTVWISAVTTLDNGFPIIGDGQATLLWLEPNSNGVGGANYIGIRSDLGSESMQPEPLVKYADAVDSSSTRVIARGPAQLLLTRVQIDVNGTQNDSVDFWVSPDLTGGVAGLEPQILYSKAGSDIFGTSFESIGISFGAGLNLMDSIRIGDSLNTVLVPEPSALLLAGVGVVIVATRARRTRIRSCKN